MTAPRPQTVRAYSLVEMIVVVSIIALLLSLVGVGATAIINSRRVNSTLATMQILETAIREFEEDRPVENRTLLDKAILPQYKVYTAWFDHLPPSPATPFNETLTPGVELPAPNEEASTALWNQARVDSVRSRFNYLVKRYLQGSAAGLSQWVAPPPTDGKEHYASIECLVLFLTQLSPRAKAIIDKLPGDVKPNLDKDSATLGASSGTGGTSVFGGRVELIEIVDSWGRPLRWTVNPHRQDLAANDGLPVRWEMRSAGKDGQFSAPFTPAEQSDDVVWPKGNSR